MQHSECVTQRETDEIVGHERDVAQHDTCQCDVHGHEGLVRLRRSESDECLQQWIDGLIIRAVFTLLRVVRARGWSLIASALLGRVVCLGRVLGRAGLTLQLAVRLGTCVLFRVCGAIISCVRVRLIAVIISIAFVAIISAPRVLSPRSDSCLVDMTLWPVLAVVGAIFSLILRDIALVLELLVLRAISIAFVAHIATVIGAAIFSSAIISVIIATICALVFCLIARVGLTVLSIFSAIISIVIATVFIALMCTIFSIVLLSAIFSIAIIGTLGAVLRGFALLFLTSIAIAIFVYLRVVPLISHVIDT